MVRSIDEEHAAICRGLADVIDVADRAFGEPRVEDREQIVQAKIGLSVEDRENEGAKLTVPITLRVPLPALERRANIYLRLDTVADPGAKAAADAAAPTDQSRTVTATVLSRFTKSLEGGVRLDVIWDDGPQTGLAPFVRWEWRSDPNRVYFEQQVYWRTNQGAGLKTILQYDRVLSPADYLRFRSSMESNHHDPGRAYEHAVLYRRLVPERDLVLSAELGVKYSTYDGDPETKTPGAAEDPDEGYLQLRTTGKVWRPWIEYELTPAAHLPWRHSDKMEFGVTFTLRMVYESFLHGPE
jgi:hypothetical protein